MKKLLIILAMEVLIILAACRMALAQPSRAVQTRNATAVLGFLTAHLNVREATGRNDGPGVAALVRAGGGNPADRPEWCGYTRAAANRACGLPIPGNGMQGAAAAWFRPGPRLVYRAGGSGSLDSLRPGLCGGIWHGNNVHHIVTVSELGRPVRQGRAPRTAWCLAGNEGSGTNAGLHRSLYPVGAFFALSNWLY